RGDRARRDPRRAVLDPAARRCRTVLARLRERPGAGAHRPRRPDDPLAVVSPRRPAGDAELRTIEWRNGRVRLIDQRALPGRLVFLECRAVDELIDAIQTLAVRGAPALGAAGAYGVALAAHTVPA